MQNVTALPAPQPAPKGSWWTDAQISHVLDTAVRVALESHGIDPAAPPAPVFRLHSVPAS